MVCILTSLVETPLNPLATLPSTKCKNKINYKGSNNQIEREGCGIKMLRTLVGMCNREPFTNQKEE